MDIKTIVSLWRAEYIAPGDEYRELRKIDNCYNLQEAIAKGGKSLDIYCIYSILSDSNCTEFINENKCPDTLLIPNGIMYGLLGNNTADNIIRLGIIQDILLSRGIKRIALNPDGYYYRGSRFMKFLIALNHYSWQPVEIATWIPKGSKVGEAFLVFELKNDIDEN